MQGDPERDVAAYSEAARRRVDAFADARIRRLRDLTDRLIATAETVERRFGEASGIKEQLDDLVAALGAAAERAAEEARKEWIDPHAPAAAPPPQVHDTGGHRPPPPRT